VAVEPNFFFLFSFLSFFLPPKWGDFICSASGANAMRSLSFLAFGLSPILGIIEGGKFINFLL